MTEYSGEPAGPYKGTAWSSSTSARSLPELRLAGEHLPLHDVVGPLSGPAPRSDRGIEGDRPAGARAVARRQHVDRADERSRTTAARGDSNHLRPLRINVRIRDRARSIHDRLYVVILFLCQPRLGYVDRLGVIGLVDLGLQRLPGRRAGRGHSPRPLPPYKRSAPSWPPRVRSDQDAKGGILGEHGLG